MSDRRAVQNPFDPSGWTGRVEIVDIGEVLLLPASSEPIIGDDAQRLWFLVSSVDRDNSYLIWPMQQQFSYGISPVDGTGSILVHNASYPGAVQSTWYGLSGPIGQAVYIVAGRAIL